LERAAARGRWWVVVVVVVVVVKEEEEEEEEGRYLIVPWYRLSTSGRNARCCRSMSWTLSA
jgi:hypothetical protein